MFKVLSFLIPVAALFATPAMAQDTTCKAMNAQETVCVGENYPGDLYGLKPYTTGVIYKDGEQVALVVFFDNTVANGNTIRAGAVKEMGKPVEWVGKSPVFKSTDGSFIMIVHQDNEALSVIIRNQ